MQINDQSTMKSNPELKTFYPLLVWAIILLISPIIWLVWKICDNGYSESIGLGEILFPMILVSIFMSLPTLLVTWAAYLIMIRKTRDTNLMRLVILIITLIGIWISFYELGGLLVFQLAISYSAGALIAVLLTTPKKKSHLPVTFR